jgi:hypothetical protein
VHYVLVIIDDSFTQDGLDYALTINGPGNVISGWELAVPTLSQWGMIIFMVLAGLGSVYYLRRQRRTES